MEFRSFGKEDAPVVMLIPGLGVSYEIFEPLIGLIKDRYRVVAVEVDGFILGKYTHFTSIDDQAAQLSNHIASQLGGRVECIYGLYGRIIWIGIFSICNNGGMVPTLPWKIKFIRRVHLWTLAGR